MQPTAPVPAPASPFRALWVILLAALLALVVYAVFHKQRLAERVPADEADAVTPHAQPQSDGDTTLVQVVRPGGAAAAEPPAPDTSEKWAHHRGRVPFIVGYEKGMDAAAKSGKPPMLFFTTTWCGWCSKLAAESFTDAQVVNTLKRFTPILVDGDTESSVTAKYQVDGYPTIVFTDKKGAELKRIGGYVPVTEFREIATLVTRH
jgi:thiol:disulfide interchange protein